jgi:hypothetical protein
MAPQSAISRFFKPLSSNPETAIVFRLPIYHPGNPLPLPAPPIHALKDFHWPLACVQNSPSKLADPLLNPL